MANELTLAGAPKLPDDLASFFEENSNLTETRVTVPSLSYEGKAWTISLNGEKTKLMKRNAEGEQESLQVMHVVVLDYAKRRGRTYYEGAYVPGQAKAPVCWSDDSIKPHESVQQKQHPTCEGCPMSIKGSKVNDQGKQVTACAQHRMLAVIPGNKLDFTPLRLKLAITSLWDGQNPEMETQGWFAFENYTEHLKKLGGVHTAKFITKMKFDPNAIYPKVLFSRDRWLTPDELRQFATVIKTDAVQSLLGGNWTPNGVDGEKVIDNAEVIEEEVVKPAIEKTPPPPRRATKASSTVKVQKAAPPPVEDDEDYGEVILPETKPVPKSPAKKVNPATAPVISTDVPDELQELLGRWEK